MHSDHYEMCLGRSKCVLYVTVIIVVCINNVINRIKNISNLSFNEI